MIFNNSIIEAIDFSGNNFLGHLPSTIGLHLPNLLGLHCAAASNAPLIRTNLSGIIHGRYLRFLAIESTPSKGVLSNLNGNFSASLEYLFAVLNGEYGSEGVVSTFTKKKPTDEVFAGETSLKRWVEETLADAVNEAVDANLPSREDDEEGKAEFVA
ncbi:hypothetical protein WN944_011993 [Citrus x changshan-huyou]|uniref:Uncharacterized protein n=1 Tax=Citrus x changshan-huyou TaxID=2935761 RepID=A0AAP0MZB8_9ROSI